MIFESVYEPIFSNNSHGFRPNRSCHTALDVYKRQLVFRADRTDLEALVAEGKKIVENASKYIQDETWATFKTILGDAETLLENDNATQEAEMCIRDRLLIF